jgi:2-phosphosulfolactate phosphatase
MDSWGWSLSDGLNARTGSPKLLAMRVDVVFLPRLLRSEQLEDRAVVVLDVLRATTSIVAALEAGASEIRVFESTGEVRAAALGMPRWGGGVADRKPGAVLLCGEERCLPPEGFDLGNSPAEFTSPRCAGRTILMSTTNGTRAIIAARQARLLYAAALVNARAMASHVARTTVDVTLLCAGTGGEVALEDVLGAGAVLAELHSLRQIDLVSDSTRMAAALFGIHRRRLVEALGASVGGRNVLEAGFAPDIRFASSLNTLNVVAEINPTTLTVTRAAVD